MTHPDYYGQKSSSNESAWFLACRDQVYEDQTLNHAIYFQNLYIALLVYWKWFYSRHTRNQIRNLYQMLVFYLSCHTPMGLAVDHHI